jgi:hypothetical protein
MGIKGNPYGTLTAGCPNPECPPGHEQDAYTGLQVYIEDVMTRLHQLGIDASASMTDVYDAIMSPFLHLHREAPAGGVVLVAIADHPSRVPTEKRATQAKRRRVEQERYEAGFRLEDYGIVRAGTDTPVRVDPQVLIRSPGGRHAVYTYVIQRAIMLANTGGLPEGFRMIFHFDESSPLLVEAGRPFRILDGFDAPEIGEGDLLAERWRLTVRGDNSFFAREFPDAHRGRTGVCTTDTDNMLYMLLHLKSPGVPEYGPGELYWLRNCSVAKRSRIDIVLLRRFLDARGWNNWSLLTFAIAMGCDYFEKWWTTDCIGKGLIATWLAEAPGHHWGAQIDARARGTPIYEARPDLVREYLDYLVLRWYEGKTKESLTPAKVLRLHDTGAVTLKKKPTPLARLSRVQASAKRPHVSTESVNERIDWMTHYVGRLGGSLLVE